MIVVCRNDFPFCVLPVGTTSAQANVYCVRLIESDKHNIELRKRWGDSANINFYHWCDVAEAML